MFAIGNRQLRFQRQARDHPRGFQRPQRRRLDGDTIRAAIPTIKKVLEKGRLIILMSHLGRPKKNPDPKFSLEQIVRHRETPGREGDVRRRLHGEKVAEMAANLKPGEVMLLENLRFYAEEEGKPAAWPKTLPTRRRRQPRRRSKRARRRSSSNLGLHADCYINDAFGTAHRAHASTALIADYFQRQDVRLCDERFEGHRRHHAQPAAPVRAILAIRN